MHYRNNAPQYIEKIRKNISNWQDIITTIESIYPELAPINTEAPLGCGHFGCVFTTKEPSVLVKFTVDKLEPIGVQALLNTKKDWPGLLKIFGVYKVDYAEIYGDPDFDPGERDNAAGPLSVLITERVGSQRSDDDFGNLWLEAVTTKGVELDTAFFSLQQKALEAVWEQGGGSLIFWDKWIARFASYCRGSSALDDWRETYQLLWAEHGLVFPDVHLNNVGFRIASWNKTLRPKKGKWLVPGGEVEGPAVLTLDLGVSSIHGTAERPASLTTAFDEGEVHMLEDEYPLFHGPGYPKETKLYPVLPERDPEREAEEELLYKQWKSAVDKKAVPAAALEAVKEFIGRSSKKRGQQMSLFGNPQWQAELWSQIPRL